MITSMTNPQIKYLMQLQGRAKIRREHKEFVAEGPKMVAETPKDRLVKSYASDTFVKSNKAYMEKLEVPYETVSDNIFTQMSDTKTPQGILAVVKMLEYDIKDMISVSNPLLLILEDIQDPGNLGTVIRTAECAGVNGVIMSMNTVDIYNSKVIRSTMGSLYRVPFVYVRSMEDTLCCLKDKNIVLNAAHLEGSVEYTNADYTQACAFMIGNEGKGLTDASAELANRRIRIPMCGQAESLNAAAAAAVLLFEAKRQRR